MIINMIVKMMITITVRWSHPQADSSSLSGVRLIRELAAPLLLSILTFLHCAFYMSPQSSCHREQIITLIDTDTRTSSTLLLVYPASILYLSIYLALDGIFAIQAFLSHTFTLYTCTMYKKYSSQRVHVQFIRRRYIICSVLILLLCFIFQD